jgi:type III secretion protein V
MNRILGHLSALNRFNAGRNPDVILALFVSAVVAMLIIPMPSILLDVMIASNIAASFLILIVALFAKNALEVSTFPSFLLISTLFRLALNVSTTRGILSRGEAGGVVHAFGEVVVQGDLLVGVVVFLVITLVQFLVIAKGSERVAEVAARFTLDAMPGKQMSIDAAVRAGSLTDDEGQDKRDELQRESQLFGAMDGAMKFVKGDAIAGLVITAINLIGGISIGVLRNGMDAGEAANVYSLLTIGDALAAQVPALLITLGSGILVTRVESKSKNENLAFSMKAELLAKPKVLGISAFLALAIALLPGLPALPFLFIGVVLAALAVAKTLGITTFIPVKNPESSESFTKSLSERVEQAKIQKSTTDDAAPSVQAVSIDLDPELSKLLGFADGPTMKAELLAILVPQLRDALFLETGVKFPGVRVRSMVPSLPKGTFVIRLKDVPVAQETIPLDEILVIEGPDRLRRLGVNARAAKHPISGLEVSWAKKEDSGVFASAGVITWNAAGVVALHLARVLRKNAKGFVGLQEVGEMIERMEKAYPTLVREVVPKVVTLGQLVDVLRRLVDEGVSIRDFKTILEALGELGASETDGIALTEFVRAQIAMQIAHSYTGSANRLPVLLLEPAIEDTVRSAIRTIKGGAVLSLEPEICAAITRAIAVVLQPVLLSGVRPVILTSTDVRRFMRKLIELDLPQTAVLSFDELPADLQVQPLGRATLHALEAC